MNRFFSLFIFLILFNTAALAQEKEIAPADSKIKVAQADIARYEKQADRASKATASRVLRMLPMIQSRLNGSTNKEHASWIQTKKRYDDLKSKLEMIKAGKKPAAKPAVKTNGQLTDTQIAKNFLVDYMALYNELKPLKGPDFQNPETVNKFTDKIAGLKKTTDNFKDKTSKHAIQAKGLLEKLEKWFFANVKKMAPKAKAQPVAKEEKKEPVAKAKPTPATNKELDFQSKRMLGFFDKDYRRYLINFRTIDPKKVAQLHSNIKTLENRYSKIPMKNHKLVIEARAKLDALKAKLNSPELATAIANIKAEEKRQASMVKLDYNQKLAIDTGFAKIKKILGKLEGFKKQTNFEAKPKAGLGLINELDKITKELDRVAIPPEIATGVNLRKKVAEAKAAVRAVENDLLAKFNKRDKLANIKNYPNYEKDLKTLVLLGQQYSENGVFSEGKEAFAKKLMANYKKDKKTYDDLFKNYKPFMDFNKFAYQAGYKQKEELGRKFRWTGKGFEKFEKSQKEFLGNAIKDIEEEMTKASNMLEKAIKEKKPAWLTGGVAQRVTRSGKMVATYIGVMGAENPTAKKIKEKHDVLSAKVEKLKIELREELLKITFPPEDNYKGPDRDMLIEKSKAAWNKKHPDKKILKIGIAMEQWNRKTEWRWVLDTRYKVDGSSIQTFVITKTDDKIATHYVIWIYKDHMKGEKISFTPPSDLASKMIWKKDMLLSNVK